MIIHVGKAYFLRRWICSLFLLLTFFSCAANRNLYQGQVAGEAHRIALSKEEGTGVWETDELTVFFAFKNMPRLLTLSGEIVISNRVVASYPRLDSFLLRVSLLSPGGRVLETRDVRVLYKAQSTVPQRLPFQFQSIPPEGTAAMAFSYWGRFRDYGERNPARLDIEKTPFSFPPR